MPISFNSSYIKLTSPNVQGKHRGVSDLPTTIAFSVNFRFRKLCVELHVTNLYTVLSNLMFVTSVSFIVPLATMFTE